jgi:hypothetical protein
MTKAKACEGEAKREAQELHFMVLRVWESVREWTHTLQLSSHFGSWSFDGFPNFQRAIEEVKNHWIEKFIISLESSWNIDV